MQQIQHHLTQARAFADQVQAEAPEYGRELAVVKTKIDEAELWVSMVSPEVAAKIQAREADRRDRIAAKRSR